MIPKIIHYSWFSGDPMPESYLRIMENWKILLPDYELRLWDAKALKEANLTFANEAFAARKWAFLPMLLGVMLSIMREEFGWTVTLLCISRSIPFSAIECL